MLEFTWSEMYECFWDKKSAKYKETCSMWNTFDNYQGPADMWNFCTGGHNFLWNFLGNKSAEDHELPEYWEPQPSDGLLPVKRFLASKALMEGRVYVSDRQFVLFV